MFRNCEVFWRNGLEGVFISLMFGLGLGCCYDSFLWWEVGVGCGQGAGGRVELGEWRLGERKTLRGEGERRALEVD